MNIEVGSIVEIINDNEYWDGSQAEVIRIEDSTDEFRYILRLTTDTPTGHRKAGEHIGGWQRFKVIPVLTAQDEAIQAYPNRLDVFYSKLTGNAVVLTARGHLVRILTDGTVDII